MPDSPRAKRVWKRLIEWYGARMAEQFGATPPPDWCEVVDELDNEQVKRGLSLVRQRYIQHPPTLPQFEAAMRPAPVAATSASAADKLCAHVMRTVGIRLTERQRREPWTYIGGAQGITGVVVPPDGDSAGHRVMLMDMQP